jgi:Mrp family chromosome partitioning ATPase
LRLPVLLVIPDMGWSNRLNWRWLPAWLQGQPTGEARAITDGPPDQDGSANPEQALAIRNCEDHLQNYADGLRERLLTYFEVNNLNNKKPKLVAVTGCDKGAGVSTLAAGLAASLSKTGDGNVLLVDMNLNQASTQSFHQGKLGCGLSDVLEPENRAEALVQENLYVASLAQENGEPLAKLLPSRFARLVPKIKTSDYDYIIFDMPPVSPTSATPRLASHMDIVLLVLESEKTGQQTASRAGALMRDARANVAAVINKYRPYVPTYLSQEL